MKILHLECNMGAAGDMLLAALLELHPDPEAFLVRLNGLGIPGIAVRAERSGKCGVVGTHVVVSIHGREEHSEETDHTAEHGCSHGDLGHNHTHEHGHGSLKQIHDLLHTLPISSRVHDDVMKVYGMIAHAEGHVHGRTIEDVHFHEVGTMDAVTDIVGVCLLMEELDPAWVSATPVHVGSGNVRCAHGILPVPAPATAHILREVPTYGGGIRGELCTPTGAALLKHFVKSFEGMPVMTVRSIGYGMGTKNFEAANCVRAMLGDAATSTGNVVELSCNLDDMTPEAVAFAQQILLENGALDVYTLSIGMKKGRPGMLLTCMCSRESIQDMVKLMFRHTSTLGIRESACHRYTLNREQLSVQTPYGAVRAKRASGWGVERFKAEYDDITAIARERGLSLDEIRSTVERTK